MHHLGIFYVITLPHILSLHTHFETFATVLKYSDSVIEYDVPSGVDPCGGTSLL